MKYYLVDKYDNINTTAVLDSGVGLSGARTYFLGIKKLDEKKFDAIWRVMTEDQWNLQFKVSLQNRQSGAYEWWKEDQEINKDEDNILG